jgi:hypothetical protein
MRRTLLHHAPTTLEVMDHVLGKGIVVEGERDRDATGRRGVVTDLGLLGIDTHVEVITDLDLRKPTGA